MTIRAWWYGGKNWGDILTPVLVRRLSGHEVRRAATPGRHIAVGSISHVIQENDIVWGTGSFPNRPLPKVAPNSVRVCAVRGPLTRDALQRVPLEVPEVYGDPALLVPYLYKPDPEKLWDFGIVPHMIERDAIQVPESDSIHVIDICGGVEEVIQQVCACRAILSSTLHGLVLAEAYGIQSAWLQIDGGKNLVGRGFKFKDYLLATGREATPTPVRGDEVIDPEKGRWLPPVEIDLQQLFDSCPFKRSEYQQPEDILATPLERWGMEDV